MKPPAPLLFVPVKAAVTPPAGQNKPFLGEDAEARMVDSIQTVPVNPFRRATKGTDSGAQYYTFQIDFFFSFLYCMHLIASFVPKNAKTEPFCVLN